MKLDDKVKVVRKATEKELIKYGLSWHTLMNKYIGQTHTIIRIDSMYNSIRLLNDSAPDEDFYFPPEILFNVTRIQKFKRIYEE